MSRLDGIKAREIGDYWEEPIHLRTDLDFLLAKVQDLREGLKKLEWADIDGIKACRVCERMKYDHHKPDCWLAALLEDK